MNSDRPVTVGNSQGADGSPPALTAKAGSAGRQGGMRVLLFSSLYPSSARPGHGIFVETRLRELLRDCGAALQAKVIAPVPWFPSTDSRWGDYAAMARTPRRELRNGIDVLHPRFVVLPKIGMHLAPVALALSALRVARRLVAEGFDFDLIDAHYFYPDGVAAAMLARMMAKPLVITARGSDVNLIASHALPRLMMRWASRQAGACIGVSQALVDAMRAMGVPPDRLHMLRNGVDLDRFHPIAQADARAAVGFDGCPLLLSVGNLVDVKGHALCIDALAMLKRDHPMARLLVVGSGPDREALTRHAEQRGVADRVHLIGAVANAELARWYSAADALLLASSREGWPNVLLESMACGTPVVASCVGGVPEIVQGSVAGSVVAQRTPSAFAEALEALLRRQVRRAQVRQYAEGFTWERTSHGQLALFQNLVARGHTQSSPCATSC